MKLVHLFSARLWTFGDTHKEPEVRIYKVLRDAAEQSGVETEIDCLGPA